MNNDKKNTNLKTDIIGFTAFGLVILLGILFTLWPSLPKTKTNFNSYEEFRNYLVTDIFPEELPKSVSDVKYYYYHTGFGKKIYGISMTLNQDDFDMAKEEYDNKLLDIYTEKNAKTKKIIDDEPVSDVLINNKNDSFWKYLATEEMSDYNLVGYVTSKSDSYKIDNGVIVNEKTKRIIIISLVNAYWN